MAINLGRGYFDISDLEGIIAKMSQSLFDSKNYENLFIFLLLLFFR